MASNDHNLYDPWWVRLLTDGGRPIVTILVLILCAPGEHHLGIMAGWSSTLAWGVAALFAAYAGIAAVVAVRRPKGAPGRATANIGSLIALGLAMAAQPIAHLYIRGVWHEDPHRTVWLIVGVSCVPALVLSHLLHLAASPVSNRVTHDDAPADQLVDAPPLHLVPPVSHPELPAAPRASKQLLTTRDVMEQRGVSRATITRWVNSGLLTVAGKDANGGNLYHPDEQGREHA